ncbi:sensor histidine kinase [Skermanella mucosa]|uniref:stimulus-sensing domain-containing protein n=1 Tax=Skermanella mucosa TaxID=1789672 RepID=UPI00192B18D3|nr:stimulus-sensing domain-containing protein [Skermanella mucosa]UEM20556.1 sensor histidine kinase [Skermanella mucosa]
MPDDGVASRVGAREPAGKRSGVPSRADPAEARRRDGADRAQPRRYRRTLSPLTLRILAVNVLALAILVGGLLYLGRYQDRLIESELEALRTEARIFAGAIGEAAVTRGGDESNELSYELARQMVRRLVETTDTRTRLFDPSGTLVADSRVLIGPGGVVQIEELPPPVQGGPVARFAIDLYDGIVNALPSRDKFPVFREGPVQVADKYADVVRALAGDVSASVWTTHDHGMMLTVAVPVQRFKQVLGAVMLSRGGAQIDAAIRSVRLDILKVFAVALAVTVLLSFYLAGTIARPIRKLAVAADHVRRGHGRHHEIPDFSWRGDEIGDLSGALRDMTAALWQRMDAIESFAADVAHEIKNPLTSLRSAVETVARVRDPDQQRRLMSIIEDDIQRMDRLISDISNASRLDAELSRAEAEPVDIGRMLRMLADIHQTTAAERHAPRVVLELPPAGDLTVPGLEGRLVQVFQNVIANAVSFSPPGGTVTVRAAVARGTPEGERVEVTVEDDGPGIPEGKLDAIFDRFYTERPVGEKFGTHSGLGLSISKQIVDAHGGEIFARNRRDGRDEVRGAVFTVRLPRA